MSDLVRENSLCAGQLVWRDKNENLREYILHPDETATIGRDRSNQIVLFDPMVSKKHAEIRWVDEEFILRDLGSSNGTMLNGDPVYKPAPLGNDSQINIGKSALNFYILKGDVLANRLQDSSFENQVTNVLGEMEWAEDIPEATPANTSEFVPEESETIQTDDDLFSLQYPESEPMLLDDDLTSFVNELQMNNETDTEDLPDVNETPNLNSLPNLPDLPKTPDLAAVLQSPEQEKKKLPRFMEEAFRELVEQIQAVQAMVDSLRTKSLNMQNVVEDSVNQLDETLGSLKALQNEASQTKVEELLTELTNSPNDVRLLLELANNAELIAKLLQSLSTQRNLIAEVKTELEFALKDDMV